LIAIIILKKILLPENARNSAFVIRTEFVGERSCGNMMMFVCADETSAANTAAIKTSFVFTLLAVNLPLFFRHQKNKVKISTDRRNQAKNL
jgi:hypothetical protein